MAKDVYKAHYCYYIADAEELGSGRWLENSVGPLREWWHGRHENNSFAAVKKSMEAELHKLLAAETPFTGAAMIWDLRGEWIVFHWYEDGQLVGDEPPAQYSKNWRYLSYLKE